jgi:hypothetical protein
MLLHEVQKLALIQHEVTVIIQVIIQELEEHEIHFETHDIQMKKQDIQVQIQQDLQDLLMTLFISSEICQVI